MFDAISFTEAESRIYKEMESLISGEFLVTNIRKANYADIFNFVDGDRWYKCKVSFVAVDVEAGKEKKISNQILVFALDVKDAFDKVHQGMNGSTVDFEVNSIMESPILDFFPYFKDEETAPEGREISRRPAASSSADEEMDEDEEA